MEPGSGDEEILYKLASECEGLFDDVHEALKKSGSSTLAQELCAEFQQRFAIWTAHLGVFARKSQCLDTRLRNFPDLQDLSIRLLDLLRRCLYQWYMAISRPGEEKEEHLQVTLQGIDDTLSRLSNLGVTIRQSSADKAYVKARKSATRTNSSFEYLCAQAVHALYPRTSQALKDLLVQSMTNRWNRMMHLGKRHEQLSTRRKPRAGLETIPETPVSTTQAGSRTAAAPGIPLTSRPKALPAPSTQSDLSTVNIQQIRSRNRPPDELSTRFAKTLSVQVKQGNYPRPPDNKGGSTYFACQWCSESINGKTLTDNAWRYVTFGTSEPQYGHPR